MRKRQDDVSGLYFFVYVHMELSPSPHIHMRPPESWPSAWVFSPPCGRCKLLS